MLEVSLKDSFKKIYESENLKFIIGAIVLIAIIDFACLSINQGQLFHEIRIIFVFCLLFLTSTEVADNFFVWGLLVVTPNLFALAIMAFAFSAFGQFLWAGVFSLSAIAVLQICQSYFLISYVDDKTHKALEKELKDEKENSLAAILHLSLLGCMKEQSKVVAQTYHILEDNFKTRYGMLFLADYNNNQLIPVNKPNMRSGNKTEAIMVQPEFWQKYALEPEKGMMNIIAGRSGLPTLKQLIPQASQEALIAMPLSVQGKVLGLITILKKNKPTDELPDSSMFSVFGYVLASALDNCKLHELRSSMLDEANKKSDSIKKAFGKYVSSAVVDELVKNDVASLGGTIKTVSILMADLRGFTALTTKIPIKALEQILNRWFEIASKIILESNGTIDKYMGDCVMVIFGAPISKPDDVIRSVYTAMRLHEGFKQFQQEIKSYIPEDSLGLGVSITTGQAIVGNFGSSTRMDYTALGEIVNLSARLEKLAGIGEIVVDVNTFNQIPQHQFRYEIKENVPIKGTANQTVVKIFGLANQSQAV